MANERAEISTANLMIANRWRPGSKQEWRDVVNPASERVIGRVAVASRDDLDEALTAAAAGFEVWRKTPAFRRAQVLTQAAQILMAKRDQMARAPTVSTTMQAWRGRSCEMWPENCIGQLLSHEVA